VTILEIHLMFVGGRDRADVPVTKDRRLPGSSKHGCVKRQRQANGQAFAVASIATPLHRVLAVPCHADLHRRVSDDRFGEAAMKDATCHGGAISLI
jgi:hypothetical protein